MENNAEPPQLIANTPLTDDVSKTENLNQKQATSIIDLNDDCLEKILEYEGTIWQTDLVNFAEAHPRFEAVAARVYGLKHSFTFIVELSGSRRDKYHLRLLHHFGHVIKHLFLCPDLTKFDFRILTAIAEHCGETLTALNMRFEGSSISRVKGKKYCHQFLQQLSTKFIKLQFLHYDGGNYRYFQRLNPLVQHFPCLISLTIDVYQHSKDQFEEIIRLNPQLIQLNVEFHDVLLTQRLVAFIDENLQGLERLTVICSSFEQIDWFQPRHFRNLITLSVNGPHLEDMLNLLAICSDKLKDLMNICRFSIMHRAEMPTEIICRFTQLTSIWVQPMTDDDIMALARNLPLLEKWMSPCADVTAPTVVEVVNQLANLKKLAFTHRFFQDEAFVNHIKRNLSSTKWNISDSKNKIEIARNN